ncbi:MAG: RNA polymerase subunit sigma-70, partial [Solirubrobacteraceae bacterium]
AFDSRLPATGRERAPLPNSKGERDIVGHAYQGRDAIGAFLRGAEERRGAPMRLVARRANTQPAFGCYLSWQESDVARAFSLFVLTVEGAEISAITWFADSSVFPHFGLPRMLA